MEMEAIMSLVKENFVALIPVLYVVGTFLKKTEKVNDKWIPLTLMGVGIVLAMPLADYSAGVVLGVIEGIVQGVLVAGGAVLANQVVKQAQK